MRGSETVRILYMTYDGLTSLIGQSQVWPYIKGLSAAGHRFDLITFEHGDRFERIGKTVAGDIEDSAVTWHPCTFRSRPPILAKILDLHEMKTTARRVAATGRFDIAHARSYPAADAALNLKRRSGLPFIFDTRGFLIDQRRDGNRWPRSNPFYRALYNRWKAKEAAFISNADHIIVLSNAARGVIETWGSYRGQPITVIPCCIDHQVFTLRTAEARAEARARLDIDARATVLVYLGSLGTVYLLPEMLRFFDRVRRARPGAKLLFVGQYSARHLIDEARAAEVELTADDLRLQFAEHGEVPFWLAAADLALCLITQQFSSRGVSPTKLGEYLACGLPVVVNDRVGDVGEIVEQLGAGAVLSNMSESEMDGVVSRLDDILAIDPAELRERSRKILDMPVALDKYRQVYDSIAARSAGPGRMTHSPAPGYRITVLLPYERFTAPSQRFRWEQWAGHLEAHGMSVNLLPFSTPSLGAARRKKARILGAFLFAARYLPWLIEVLREALRSDLVVVHRNAALTGPPVAEAILAAFGKPLVYDLDDAIYLPPESGDNFWRRLVRCDWRCGFIGRHSTLIGAGCPVLRDHMARYNQNVVLWPTTVDTERCQQRTQPDATAIPVIGWTGSQSTAHYLETILPALASLQREITFELLVIGVDMDLEAHGVRGHCVPWSAETEVESTMQIDIGLMPLADTAWARGKCALKAIQYQAFGTPAVVSDVGVNSDVVIDGETGFLVEPGGDWAPALRKLLSDRTLRHEMGRKGRAHVTENYSAAVVAAKIASDLRLVLEAQRQKRQL